MPRSRLSSEESMVRVLPVSSGLEGIIFDLDHTRKRRLPVECRKAGAACIAECDMTGA
jgi:hypothetical protein